MAAGAQRRPLARLISVTMLRAALGPGDAAGVLAESRLAHAVGAVLIGVPVADDDAKQGGCGGLFHGQARGQPTGPNPGCLVVFHILPIVTTFRRSR